jgi:5-methylcytosine-specific restriction enzyme subunit McrC
LLDKIIYITEQQNKTPIAVSAHLQSVLVAPVYKKAFHPNSDMLCFHLHNDNQNFTVDTNYFIGVDWLVPRQAAVYVESKLNDTEQVDFLGILLQSLKAPENLEHLNGLFHVEYESPWIPIPEQKDLLSPILIVQFLKLIERIVRKGLKKSYYRVTENLDSRIKGKILVGQQIKTNIVKNRLTKTTCNFQEYGFNTTENQFLKLVLEFVSSYINQTNLFFNKDQIMQLRNILSYCMPSFEYVDSLEYKHEAVHIKKNAFYMEYEEAIKIGGYILKRFSFNINKASQSQTSTPPFWIDMSKLFEIYVFGKLKKLFPEAGALTYHDNFRGGKQTDILVRAEGFKCVIDCKYKPRYVDQDPSLDDKRQLAGYVRLKSVYNKLAISTDKLIKGLIIYSNQTCEQEIKKQELFINEISEYVEFYKLGVKLPVIPATLL